MLLLRVDPLQVSWLLAAAQEAAAHSADLSASTVLNIASGVAITLCGVIALLWKLDRSGMRERVDDLKLDIVALKAAQKDTALEAQKLINRNDEQTDRIEELVEELVLAREECATLRTKLERYETPPSDAGARASGEGRITGSFGVKRRRER